MFLRLLLFLALVSVLVPRGTDAIRERRGAGVDDQANPDDSDSDAPEDEGMSHLYSKSSWITNLLFHTNSDGKSDAAETTPAPPVRQTFPDTKNSTVPNPPVPTTVIPANQASNQATQTGSTTAAQASNATGTDSLASAGNASTSNTTSTTFTSAIPNRAPTDGVPNRAPTDGVPNKGDAEIQRNPRDLDSFPAQGGFLDAPPQGWSPQGWHPQGGFPGGFAGGPPPPAIPQNWQLPPNVHAPGNNFFQGRQPFQYSQQLGFDWSQPPPLPQMPSWPPNKRNTF